MMKSRSSLLVIIVASLMAALAFWVGAGPSEGLQPVTVGIDLDTTGNSATSLGPIDRCVPVDAGAEVTFDTFIDSIPAAEELAGFNYILEFPEAAGAVITSQSHDFILATNLDLTEVVPDPPGMPEFPQVGEHRVAPAVLRAPPTPGGQAGVLGRYTMSTAGMAADVYSLSFKPETLGFASSEPVDWVGQVTEVLSAFVAVGVDCPAEAPPSRPGPNPTPLALLTPESDATPDSQQTPGVEDGTPRPGEDTQGTPPAGDETEGTPTGTLTPAESPTGDGGEGTPAGGTAGGSESGDGGNGGPWAYVGGGIGIAALALAAGALWWRRQRARDKL